MENEKPDLQNFQKLHTKGILKTAKNSHVLALGYLSIGDLNHASIWLQTAIMTYQSYYEWTSAKNRTPYPGI